ncbi:hypothetical protein J3L18_05370 [Mucilaginibacter gossypii]|uniref:hypothetical protein n=1 Tax=Mucilaginibacter gossypii TaxID=551996 RepID=UPI000DCC8776|nr:MULTISPECIES: hypothetical protein [Mucilaginibacter]QTE38508.1 hypothetical protein J3L18_05370 [Mucilaginibacter gossypii]RAV55755.1 hypothetical protein DIU36_16825 [Mucilaginibacter rubeus]
MDKKELLSAKALQDALAAAKGDPDKIVQITTNAIAALANQENNVESATQVINELQTANERQKKADKNYRPEVAIKNDVYRVVHGITVHKDGAVKVLGIDEIAGDQKLILALVKEGSTAIKQLPKAD